MDRSDLLELLPHYVVMLLLMVLVLGALRQAVPGVSFWIEVVVIFALVFAYRTVIQRSGYAPSVWDVDR